MNICMFGSSFLPRRGGMEFVIHHLSNALVHEGHNVTVIAERTAWRGIGVDHDYDLVRKGCDWFSRNFPKQYMVLLD